MPKHKGLTDYSYTEDNIDFDLGGVIGTKITKRIGIFIEGKWRRYWDIDNYELKTGVNYIIK